MPLDFLNFNNLVFTVSDVLFQQIIKKLSQQNISKIKIEESLSQLMIIKMLRTAVLITVCAADTIFWLAYCEDICTPLHHSCPLLYFSPPELPPSPCLPFIFGITTPALHSLQMSSFSVDLTSSCTGWVLQWEKISLHHLVR